MICYLCGMPIGEHDPFYNDHEKQVCKPCFKDASRCFVCRFPGQKLETVEGLGLECEFCRGHLIAEGDALAEMVSPLIPFLAGHGIQVPQQPHYAWLEVRELREMQCKADLPPMAFIDDFLRNAYPVYYDNGTFHCLKRMTKASFIVYVLIQFAAADIARRHGLSHLLGNTPFHTFSRGFCHWVGAQAAERLGYGLEQRQLRKWPELGAMGEFERWQGMARFHKTSAIVTFFQANLKALGNKHLLPR